jgi:hypothetical protein
VTVAVDLTIPETCQFFLNPCRPDLTSLDAGWLPGDSLALIPPPPNAYLRASEGLSADDKWQICVLASSAPVSDQEIRFSYVTDPASPLRDGALFVTTHFPSILGTVHTSGVRVSLTGDRTLSTFSDANGQFSFAVPPGSYDVTPLPGAVPFRFDPPSRHVTFTGAGDVSVDFNPVPTFTFTASASADPQLVPIGGTVNLHATVTGALGRLAFLWRGYRDDGANVTDALVDRKSASTSTPLGNPGTDFYFFVTVTDEGQPGNPAEAVVRVHETDGPVARLSVSPASIVAGVNDVTADGTGSTGNLDVIVEWTLESMEGVPPPRSLEEYLLLAQSNPGRGWDVIMQPTVTTDLTMKFPASMFAGHPGAYRVRLGVQDFPGALSPHRAYEYFYVYPP